MSSRWVLAARSIGVAALMGAMAVPALAEAAAGTGQSGGGQATADPSEARVIAKEAWIYAYAPIMNYQTIWSQAVDSHSPAYVGGFGRFRHYSTFYTPKNRDIVTPNNDTPYSWAWLDLRAEPWVLSVPAAPKDRYNVFQWVDLYTHNFAYVGVRSTGYEAGNYLFAGPGWDGKAPPGISRVIRSETSIVGTLARTSLKGPDDIENLKALQAQYLLRPLHEFAGTPKPAPAPLVSWPAWNAERALGTEFIGYLNFLMQFMQPPPPSEAPKLARFARIGIGPGRSYDPAKLDPALREAITLGAADGKQALEQRVLATNSSLGLFGSREELGDDRDMKRAVGAAVGIYGNSSSEAVYQGWSKDATNQRLVGSKRYEIRYPPGMLPPVTLFWSATMYDLPDRQLVENPIDRYSVGSNSDQLKYAADGSLTIYVQHDSPEADKAPNWLPAPSGAFQIITRLYGPKPAVLNGAWKQPDIRIVD
jgi:hypothetical protein